jgi:hypothetical protein
VEGVDERLVLPSVEYGEQLVFNLDTAKEKPDYVLLIVGPDSGSFMMKRGSGGNNFQLTLVSDCPGTAVKSRMTHYT